MRTWRVGSFSMGAALVLLGVFLLLVEVLKWDPAIAMVSWWPVLFIILGIEILFYLGMKKNEEQQVKYDFISILFIGLIGTVGLGMAVLQTTGVLELSKQFVSAEERTIDLPKYEEQLTADIQRVVIEPGSYTVNIEASTGNEAVIFGTYWGSMQKGASSIEEVSDYALIEKQGDTLYMKLKQMPTGRFMHMHNGGQLEATVLIPANVKLEVNGGNNITINPRELKADWAIADMSYVTLDVADHANVLIEAINIQQLEGKDWKKEKAAMASGNEAVEVDHYDESGFTESLVFGSGEHKLQIKNSYSVQIR
ncbi:hypothetical protein [Bacillus sp. FJAT-50079]|uniref:hypothetical protein n=1 Tax=Bacillus sp. FJAT-50079 TaxID=2833577 RepID=UPI001BCA2725|nr:hypothetical protein [Bacillus sp. FJAT-50079]MBS4209560.1 hypothetical protein [Bacillus sp. FJAT-50079]